MAKTANHHSPNGRVRVSPSNIHGRGLFAAVALPRRRKIGSLSGKIVALPGGWKKVEAQSRIYMVELTRRYALDCTRGNDFKYLNHSCQPNCYLRIYRRSVEVYALKPIESGTELTVDYGETPHKGGMACRCGVSGCKGAL